MKIVKLSSEPALFNAQRVKDEVIITLYDNVVEIPPDNEEDEMQYQADMRQLKLRWRDGIEDPSNYELMLARAKELDNPQSDGDRRVARDIVQ